MSEGSMFDAKDAIVLSVLILITPLVSSSSPCSYQVYHGEEKLLFSMR